MKPNTTKALANMQGVASRQEVQENLIAVRDLLSEERNWTKHCLMDIRNGEPCWCLVGAVSRTAKTSTTLQETIWFLKHALGCGIGDWNDAKSTTHKDVMQFLDNLLEAL